MPGQHSPGRRFLHAREPARVTGIGGSAAEGDAEYEFTGLALFSPDAWRDLVRSAAAAPTASVPDLLHGLIGAGQIVHGLEVAAGWLEIHCFEDYQLACRLSAS